MPDYKTYYVYLDVGDVIAIDATGFDRRKDGMGGYEFVFFVDGAKEEEVYMDSTTVRAIFPAEIVQESRLDADRLIEWTQRSRN